MKKDKSKKKKKDKLDELKDKLKAAINGDLSKLEYQQNLLDPKFRAAMVGFGGFPFPQSGMSNANQYLQEHREKNNELTREMAYKQDMAVIKEKYHELKRQNKALNDQLTRDTQIQRQTHQNEDLTNQLETKKKRHEEDMMFHEDIHLKNTQIKDLQRKEENQKRKHQQQKQKLEQDDKIKKLNNDINDAQKENDNLVFFFQKKSNLNETKRDAEQTKKQAENKENLAQLNHEQKLATDEKNYVNQSVVLKRTIKRSKRQTEALKAQAQNQDKIEELQHQQQLAITEQAYTPELQSIKQRIDHLKQKSEQGKQIQKYLGELSNLNNQLQKYLMNKEYQPLIDTLKQQIRELETVANAHKEENRLADEANNLQKKAIDLAATASPGAIRKHYQKIEPKIKENAELKKRVELLEDFAKLNKEREELKKQGMKLSAQTELKDVWEVDFEDPNFQNQIFDARVETQKQIQTINENIEYLSHLAEETQQKRQLEIQQRGLERVREDDEERAKALQENNSLKVQNFNLSSQVDSQSELINQLDKERDALRTRLYEMEKSIGFYNQDRIKQLESLYWNFSRYVPERAKVYIRNELQIPGADVLSLDMAMRSKNTPVVEPYSEEMDGDNYTFYNPNAGESGGGLL